jgi:hypothetical protein
MGTKLDRETIEFRYMRDKGIPYLNSTQADMDAGEWWVSGPGPGGNSGYAWKINLDDVCAHFDGPGSIAVGGECRPGTRVSSQQYAPVVSCPPSSGVGFILYEEPTSIKYQCGTGIAEIAPGDQSLPCPPGYLAIDIVGGKRYCRRPGTNAASNTVKPGWEWDAYGNPKSTTYPIGTVPDVGYTPPTQVGPYRYSSGLNPVAGRPDIAIFPPDPTEVTTPPASIPLTAKVHPDGAITIGHEAAPLASTTLSPQAVQSIQNATQAATASGQANGLFGLSPIVLLAAAGLGVLLLSD